MSKTVGSTASTVHQPWTANTVFHRIEWSSCLMVPGAEARGLVAPIICLPVLTICKGQQNSHKAAAWQTVRDAMAPGAMSRARHRSGMPEGSIGNHAKVVHLCAAHA